MAASFSLHRTVILRVASSPSSSSSSPSSSSKPIVAGGARRWAAQGGKRRRWWGVTTLPPRTRVGPGGGIAPPSAGSRADDSSKPYDMSVESALKLLGVSEGASFEDILRAKNAIIAAGKDDKETIAKVEAAYDMLLMQSLTQRRAGKVVNRNIRYADVKPARSTGPPLPQWFQTAVKNAPVVIESPTTRNLGIQGGVYGALMVFTFINGASPPSAGAYTGADVPGLLLASGFGASLYFLTKKNINLGRATIITVGGLVAGAVVGSAVENWLQVDIVPFFGIHSPAVIISEFILFSQFLVSLYLSGTEGGLRNQDGNGACYIHNEPKEPRAVNSFDLDSFATSSSCRMLHPSLQHCPLRRCLSELTGCRASTCRFKRAPDQFDSIFYQPKFHISNIFRFAAFLWLSLCKGHTMMSLPLPSIHRILIKQRHSFGFFFPFFLVVERGTKWFHCNRSLS